MTNYVIYLFSGMVMINFFNEVFGNVTRSIVQNAPLVGKIYLPRELFPVSSLWVAFVHFVPQVVVLLLGALVAGWRPTWLSIAAGLLSIVSSGSSRWTRIGLRRLERHVPGCGELRRPHRHGRHLVSPVYNWTMVADVLPGWLWRIYQANPLAVSVELSHYAFWVPTRGVIADGASAASLMPDHWVWTALTDR